MLTAAGARSAERDPDVELGRPPDLRGDAFCGVVPISRDEPNNRFRVLRGSQRLVRASRVRASVRSARRALSKVGYSDPDVLPWQPAQPLCLDGYRAHEDGPVAHRFPLNAVVFGTKAAEPTLLEAVLADVRRRLGAPLQHERIVVGSSGVIVVVCVDAVLRIAVGPGRQRLAAQLHALEDLRRSHLPAETAVELPWPVATGETGIASWSVERRAIGRTAPSPLSPFLIDTATDFLVALWSVSEGSGAGGVRDDAAVVAAHADPSAAEQLLSLAEDLERELAAVPRGFVHGDFWGGNLLVDGNRTLTGVIDWASATAHGLPLLDLLHLQVSDRREQSGARLGPALLDRIRRPTGHESATVARYCERIGLPRSTALHRDLALAYWLQALARDIVDPDREADPTVTPGWQRENLHRMLVGLS